LNSAKLLAKITEKWPVKVLSLAAALVIFVFYRTNTLEKRSFSVPLTIEQNDRFVPANFFITTVKINLRGEGGSINMIPEEDIEAFINFDKYAKEGTYRVPVQIRKKGRAIGVEPLEIKINPSQISLQLEERTTRNIPVYPVFLGTVAQNYELTDQSMTPENVIAEGPRRTLDNLHEFFTETIDLEGRYEDITVFVSIINNNPLVTVHGNSMVEYHGTVRGIQRGLTVHNLQDEEETGDSGQ
jgi:YbbR domain-containing protein